MIDLNITAPDTERVDPAAEEAANRAWANGEVDGDAVDAAVAAADAMAAAEEAGPEIAEKVAKYLADLEDRRARIAASDYRMRVTLLRVFDKIVLDIRPNEYGDAWEVTGVGSYVMSGGREMVGNVRSRNFRELDGPDGAREYANGWFASLVAKGFRRVG